MDGCNNRVGIKMILFPGKEYSQRMLDELNYIGYGFLESATEYLIDETGKEYLSQELRRFFPAYLVDQDANHCLGMLETLYEWAKDDYYHSITPLHEYVLARAIHDEWMFFDELPDDESQMLRDVFYRSTEKTQLSETERTLINSMKKSELATMDAFFNKINYSELELSASFRQEPPLFTFLRL